MRSLKKLLHTFVTLVTCTATAVQPVMAQSIVADGGVNAPTVLSTANGIDLVMIDRPNGAGVSLNTYQQFDVSESGAILNNIQENFANTNLGGLVQGNSNLSGGAATLIINQVTAPNPSELLGYLEVGGAQADVVVANAYGITCDGCGFINTDRAVLTTGDLTFNAIGQLDRISVTEGTIAIGAGGADGRGVSQFDLISRQVNFAGSVQGQRVLVIAGQNDVIFSTGEVTENDGNGSASPEYAIDSTVFGGMYANKITIVSTEAGVGVRAPQHMAASTQGMSITADGRLVIGQASSAGGMSARSNSDSIVVEQTIVTREALTLDAKRDLILEADGIIVSQAAASLRAQGNLRLDAGAQVAAQTTLTLDAGTRLALAANAKALSVGGLGLDARDITLADGAVAYAGGNLIGTARETLTNNGQIQSAGLMLLTAQDRVTNAGLIDAQNAMRMTSASSVNTGVIDTTGGALFADGLSVFDNTGGTLSSDTGIQIELSGAQTLNAANWGTVQSADWLTLQGADGGEITSLSIAADTDILANGQLVVKAQDLTNAGAVASVDGNLLVQASADITNTGLIYAGGDLLAIRAGGTVLNDGGVILAASDMLLCGVSSTDCTQDLSADRAAGLINHDGGVIETLGGDIILAAAEITNERDGTSSVAVSGPTTVLINNDPGGCSGVCLGNDSYDYTKDRITTTVRTVTVGGAPSSIISDGNITFNGTRIANDYSLISAAGNIDIQAGVLENLGDQSTKTVSTVVENWEYIDRTWPASNVRRLDSIDPAIVDVAILETFPATIEAGGMITGTVTGTLDNGAVLENVAVLTAVPSGTTAPTLGDPANITGTIDLSVLGNDQLFVTNPGGGGFVIETRPAFIDQDQFISSDYFLASLNFDPDATQIRLGDPFAETYLIRNQIQDLTGGRILASDLSEKEQIRLMYDNAVDAARDLDLRPGVALTPAQITALTTDIVWLEEQMIDGQAVLVPRVYLGASGGAGGFNPALITATRIAFNVGSLTNSGAITAFDTLVIDAASDIRNLGGSLTAPDLLELTVAQGDLLNMSGTISGGDVTIIANNIISETDVIRFVDGAKLQEVAAPSALITATSGVLSLNASGDIRVVGGDLSGEIGVQILAGSDIDFAALELNSSYDASGDDWSFTQITSQSEVSTITSAQGGVTIISAQRDGAGNIAGGGNILFEGTQIEAAGVIDMTAVGGDVVFEAATSTFSRDSSYEVSNLLSEASGRDQRFDLVNETASLTGEEINVYAAVNVAAFGTQFTTVDTEGGALTNEAAVLAGSLNITAADGDVLFYAVQDIQARSSESASSVLGGVISFDASSQSLRSDYQGVEANVLTDINLSAANGDLVIQGGSFTAGGDFNTDVGGNIYLQGTVDTRYAFEHSNDNNGFVITDSTQVSQSQIASMPLMNIGGTNGIAASDNVVIGGRVFALDELGQVTGYTVGSTHVGADMGAGTLSQLFPSSDAPSGDSGDGEDPYAADTTIRQAALNPGGAGTAYLDAVLANQNTQIGDRVDLTSIDFSDRTQSMGVLSQAALMLATQGMGTWATFAVNQVAKGIISGEFDPEEIVKSAAMTFVTAGVGDLNPDGFQGVGGWAADYTSDLNATGVFGNSYFSEQWLVSTALTSGVTSTAQTALYGGDLAANWTDAMQGAIMTEATAFGIDASSDTFGHNQFTPENFAVKAGVNCLGSMASGTSCASGIAGTLAKELFISNVDTTNMTADEIAAGVQLTAIAVGVLTSGGDIDNLNSTVNAAKLDLDNNYLNADERIRAVDLIDRANALRLSGCGSSPGSMAQPGCSDLTQIEADLLALERTSLGNTQSLLSACRQNPQGVSCLAKKQEAVDYVAWRNDDGFLSQRGRFDVEVGAFYHSALAGRGGGSLDQNIVNSLYQPIVITTGDNFDAVVAGEIGRSSVFFRDTRLADQRDLLNARVGLNDQNDPLIAHPCAAPHGGPGICYTNERLRIDVALAAHGITDFFVPMSPGEAAFEVVVTVAGLGVGKLATSGGKLLVRQGDDVFEVIEDGAGGYRLPDAAPNNAGAGRYTPSQPVDAAGNPIVRTNDRGGVLVQPNGSVTCGQHACGMVLNIRGTPVAVDDIIADFPPTSAQGTSMTRISSALRSNDVSTVTLSNGNLTVDNLANFTANGRPSIAMVQTGPNTNHFVVVDGVTNRGGQRVVAIRDPAGGTNGGVYYETVTSFEGRFTGNAIRILE